MPDGLPEDWRERFVAMVAGREPTARAWFQGGPVLGPAERAGIYREQYRWRLRDGLRAELPGAVRAWPDLPWAELFDAYLLEHPATSFTMNRVARAFPDWWAGRGASAAQVELARLDRLVSRAFDAADPTPFDPTGPMGLSPAVGLLRVTHNVHDVRHALLTDAEVPALVEERAGVVVYRRGREIRHWVPDTALFDIVEAVAGGEALGDAITAPLRSGTCDLPTLQANLQAWMAEVAERSVFSGR